jgi:hypothetical protein
VSIKALAEAGFVERLPEAPISNRVSFWYTITDLGARAHKLAQVAERTFQGTAEPDGPNVGELTPHAQRSSRSGIGSPLDEGNWGYKLPKGVTPPPPPAGAPGWLVGAWTTLTPRERVVIQWRSGNAGRQWSRKVVAERLGVSPTTVQRDEWRGLVKLARAFPRNIRTIAEGRLLLGAWLPESPTK